jgi:hypothetical protein
VAIPVLLITGPIGVGKTAVADEVSLRLERDGFHHSNIDMDGLRQVFPRPGDDPRAEQIGLQALKSVWLVHQKAGASALVIAELLSSEQALRGYRDAIPGAEIRVVALTASAEALRSRIVSRELGSDLDWALARSQETRAAQIYAWSEAVVVDTSRLSVSEVAARVLDLTADFLGARQLATE